MKRFFLPFLSFFLTFSPVLAAAPAWQAVAGGSWSFAPDSAALSRPASRESGNANIALFPQQTSNDFTLSTLLNIVPTSADWNDASVIFAYRDSKNYSYVSLNEKNDKNTNGIFQVQSGTARELLDIPSLTPAGTNHAIRIERQGTSLKVLRNGALLASTSITRDLSGSVGVGSRNDAVTFTSFALQATVPQTQPAPEPVPNPAPVSPPAPLPISQSGIDFTNWKLQLPTGAVERPDEIKFPALASFSRAPYFVMEDGALRFRAPVNGVTTRGSDYPRSELREMKNNGTEQASWSNAIGTHTMTIEQAITAVPQTKKHVVAGQIHDTTSDLIVVRLEGTKLFIDLGGADGPTLDPNYVLGKKFTIKFDASNGEVRMYYNGATTPAYTLRKAVGGLYFKAGAYTQSNCTKEASSACNDNNYGEVKIYSLNVTHQG